MNLLDSTSVGKRILRFLGEIGYAVFMGVLAFGGRELAFLYVAIDVSPKMLYFVLSCLIILFVVKNCDDYFMQDTHRKRIFLSFVIVEMLFLTIEAFAAFFAHMHVYMWFRLLGEIATIGVLITWLAQVIQRVGYTFMWMFYPFIVDKRYVVSVKTFRIIGKNSRFLSYNDMVTYTLLTIVRIMLLLFFDIYVLEYFATIDKVVRDAYGSFLWIAAVIKLSDSYNVVSFIGFLAVVVSMENYIYKFQNKLYRKIDRGLHKFVVVKRKKCMVRSDALLKIYEQLK
ncbi:hypothetical protein RA086_02290 [Lactiplantibacillus sp. WILCCON 0030]|uniref:Integral membrane protein n=1 Tax=Lactiplantibacillus brownii TaxID=3069269 RepID=A0ABU1A6B5_9LACO|nr:hypothetical protein [Lactiplantibacillus brownii]MDQ7936474.1 hypothetical protein [Lactiplantibacillus brownii]